MTTSAALMANKIKENRNMLILLRIKSIQIKSKLLFIHERSMIPSVISNVRKTSNTLNLERYKA